MDSIIYNYKHVFIRLKESCIHITLLIFSPMGCEILHIYKEKTIVTWNWNSQIKDRSIWF